MGKKQDLIPLAMQAKKITFPARVGFFLLSHFCLSMLVLQALVGIYIFLKPGVKVRSIFSKWIVCKFSQCLSFLAVADSFPSELCGALGAVRKRGIAMSWQGRVCFTFTLPWKWGSDFRCSFSRYAAVGFSSYPEASQLKLEFVFPCQLFLWPATTPQCHTFLVSHSSALRAPMQWWMYPAMHEWLPSDISCSAEVFHQVS